MDNGVGGGRVVMGRGEREMGRPELRESMQLPVAIGETATARPLPLPLPPAPSPHAWPIPAPSPSWMRSMEEECTKKGGRSEK